MHDVEAAPPVYSRPKSSVRSSYPQQRQRRMEACSDGEISMPFAARANEFAWQWDDFPMHVEAKRHLRLSVSEDTEFKEESCSEGCWTSVTVSADSIARGPVQQPGSFADTVDDHPAFGDDPDITESSNFQDSETIAASPERRMSL
mmetsp:Transcript_117767/g.227124  ORF Transcript_117767/g.227124 Transcript_117767/m.227124 type:complete len:146 (+) Transcript_117767:1-438(+)